MTQSLAMDDTPLDDYVLVTARLRLHQSVAKLLGYYHICLVKDLKDGAGNDVEARISDTISGIVSEKVLRDAQQITEEFYGTASKIIGVGLHRFFSPEQIGALTESDGTDIPDIFGAGKRTRTRARAEGIRQAHRAKELIRNAAGRPPGSLAGVPGRSDEVQPGRSRPDPNAVVWHSPTEGFECRGDEPPKQRDP